MWQHELDTWIFFWFMAFYQRYMALTFKNITGFKDVLIFLNLLQKSVCSSRYM